MLSSCGGLVVELWTDNSLPSAMVDRIPPRMACQSFGDRHVLLHIHKNAERRVPSGVYYTCLGVSC